MKSCETHLVPNCPLCAGQNNTVVPATPSQSGAPNAQLNLPGVPLAPILPATPPETKITDPTAQKMLAAAGKYAQECESVKIISEAVTRLTEVLTEAKNKLKEAETNRDAAQKEMMVLLGGKS